MSAWTQSNCGEFKDISTSCIASTNKPFSDKPIPLGKLIKDTILFYKTPSGDLGKLKILSVINSPKSGRQECTLFLDAITYSRGNAFVPNSSLSVSPRNHWQTDKIYLDREGLSAIEMEKHKESGACVLIFTKGVEYTVHIKGSNEEQKFKEESLSLRYAPLVLIFIAIFLIVRVFMEDQDKYKTQEALEEAENSTKGGNQAFFLKITKPFYKRYFLPIVQSSKHKQNFRNKYRQKLANAGLTKDMSPEEFVALKFFMIIGGPFAFLVVRWIMEESWPLSITPVMGIVGYFYPDIWIQGMIKKRAEEVLRAMPFIVDMLALSVEAGLDFMAAIQRVIEKAPKSPLVEEFETLVKETRIGSSRAEGLRQLGWRVNVIEINSFCATLIAADSVGASIGPLLKQLSSELRVKRSSRAEQQGATAATKILIPMIFFILPAVLVAIFAPMLLKMMTSGGGP
ncbi:MAG: type II secretion system F family protein [Bacteriovoracia bacterium]